MVKIKGLHVKNPMSFLDISTIHTETANKWLKLPPPPVAVQQSAWPLAKTFIYHTFSAFVLPLRILIHRVVFIISSRV